MTHLVKHSVGDLAILGGRPAFERALHVGTPNVGDRQRFLGLVEDVLDRRVLTNNGPLVLELEARLARFLGAKHCVLTSNGTVALEIAARAAGLAGEVIVPALTFVATAHALQWQGIRPVFCDVDPLTHNLDPRRVVEPITPETTGILGVHLWGRPCDVAGLTAIARQHGLKLLFDAAHAFGCSHRGRMVGTLGDAEVFSFHATKVFNTIEGGAVVTDDDALAAQARLLRNFGFADYDRVVSLGINGKLNELSAAMGLTLLDEIEELVGRNHRNYLAYRQTLAGCPGLTLIRYDAAERNNYQYVVVEVDAAAAGISRDELVDVLWAENVLARRYFFPGCHRMEPYASQAPWAGLALPQTERLTSRLLSLPTGVAVDGEAIAAIGGVVRFCVERSAEFRARWRGGSGRESSREALDALDALVA